MTLPDFLGAPRPPAVLAAVVARTTPRMTDRFSYKPDTNPVTDRANPLAVAALARSFKTGKSFVDFAILGKRLFIRVSILVCLNRLTAESNPV